MERLIALTGYGRAGKDVLGAVMIERAGYTRLCPGDIIKAVFDPVCQQMMGFSAFTEVPAEKEQIRPLLVHGGQSFYEPIFTRYFRELDALTSRGVPVINTRLFRIEEAEKWRERGGVIWEVTRKDNPPKEPEEARSLEELRAWGFIDETIHNSGTLRDWEIYCIAIAQGWA